MTEHTVNVPGSEARAVAEMVVTLDARRQRLKVEMIANGFDADHVTSEARPGDSDPPTYQGQFDSIDQAITRLQEAYSHVWDEVLEVVGSARGQ